MKFIAFTDSNKNEENQFRIYNLDKVESFTFYFSEQIGFVSFSFLLNQDSGIACDFSSTQEGFEDFKKAFTDFLESDKKVFNLNDFSANGEVQYQFFTSDSDSEDEEEEEE